MPPGITWALLSAALMLSVWASSGPIQWMDNGVMLLNAAQGRYFPVNVGATAHPLYYSLNAVLFQWLGVYAVAYLNSFLLVPLAYMAYKVSRTLNVSRPYAALAALGVVLLHSVFWVSTKMEVYALHLLLVLISYWLMFDEELSLPSTWKIFALGLLTGLGAATHQLTFIVLFPLYLYVLHAFGWRLIVLAIPGFFLGMFPCYPPLVHKLLAGESLLTLMRMFLTDSDGGSSVGWEGALLRFDRIWNGKSYMLLVLISMVGVGLFGFLVPRGRKEGVLWWAATLNLLFAVSYDVSDRFTFFLPGGAFYVILGIAYIEKHYGRYASTPYATVGGILAHPACLVVIAALVGHGIVTLPSRSSSLPYRDEIRYFLAPYIQDTSAERFALAYDQQVPRGAVILADYSPMGALQAAQVTGRFADNRIISCEEQTTSLPATVYLVRTDNCERMIQHYSLEAASMGWKLRKHNANGATDDSVRVLSSGGG
ncbi:MAG TPA: hypothetical protein VJ746_02070 [Nitrospira sp.]|nr:hypothetical protein [Nitrospira sp.]